MPQFAILRTNILHILLRVALVELRNIRNMPRCMICVPWSARWRKCWIEFDIVSCVFDDRSAPGGYLYKKSPSKRAFIKSWDWRLATHNSQISVAKNCYDCYPCDDVDIDHRISQMIIDDIVSVPNCAGVIIQSDALFRRFWSMLPQAFTICSTSVVCKSLE